MEKRTVILYGQSMLLALVANNLARSKNLHIIQASTWAEVVAQTAECIPDVLIYDLASASEGHILPLLFEHPHMLLIGLDVETNQAVLLSGQEARSLTLSQIKEIIEHS